MRTWLEVRFISVPLQISGAASTAKKALLENNRACPNFATIR